MKILKKPKSLSCSTRRKISPCALGLTLGLFTGVNFLLYVVLAKAEITFLWYNPAVFDMIIRWIPEWIPISYGGAVVSGLYGVVLGGISGMIIAWLYNWRITACNCKWCSEA